MFNFNLQQKAFEELSAEQFRVVYFLNNTLSMVNESNKTPDNNKIEMFNGYLMDKLGLKERMVQYHIKTLEQKGYIKVKRPIGRNASKQPNIITLIFEENNATDCALSQNNAINDAINDAIDCTLNKNTKENKKYNINIYSICTSTGTSDDSYIIQSNDVNNINSNELNNMVSGVTYYDGESNNDKKENEMSDNGTNAMNAIEAKENESSGCDTENEMITSTSAEENNSSMGDYNVNGQNPTESSNLLAAAPTREEITALKEKIWQIKDKKDYADFKPYLDRFIGLMNRYKTAYPNDSNFIQTMRNWYKNSLQYFPKNEVSQQELLILNYHLESLRLADTVEKLNNAILRIDGWIQKVEQQHRMTKELMNQITKYTEREAQNNKTIWQEWSEKLNQAS